jgi:flavin reductase (DIM6/NTAB) family NADH-FMN oxidoreductase RutF
MRIIPGEVKTAVLHSFLLSAVAPRPICFASTIDEDGNRNLSPFSFFNVFGAKPPILIFSPARRVRDNTVKHTLDNVLQMKEVVINIVNYDIVQQMSLSSCEYPQGVDEFIKAGLTPIASDLVKPFRVKEAPVQLECKVLQVIPTGEDGGAGNLVICEVVCMHVNDDVLNEQGMIDIHKIDLVARMGGDYYCRASGDSIFEVPKPNSKLGIGVDGLPLNIQQSAILTGNNLGVLGNAHELPAIDESFVNESFTAILQMENKENILLAQHTLAKTLIDNGDVATAWQILLR